MRNDLTYLRFHDEEVGNIPRLSPEELTLFCADLSNVYAVVSGAMQIEAILYFSFAAPPRRGCLEIVLLHDLDVSSGLPVSSTLAAQEPSFARLLYRSIFGKGGVVDRDRQGLSDQPAPGKLIDATTMEAAKDVVSGIAMRNKDAVGAVRALLSSAGRLHMAKVEILVPDEEPLTLFSAYEPRLATLIRLLRKKPIHGVGSVALIKGPSVRGKLAGLPFTLFLGKIGGAGTTVAVLWRPERIPKPGEAAQVRAVALGMDALADIEFDGDIPPEFENAEGIVAVHSMAVWTD